MFLSQTDSLPTSYFWLSSIFSFYSPLLSLPPYMVPSVQHPLPTWFSPSPTSLYSPSPHLLYWYIQAISFLLPILLQALSPKYKLLPFASTNTAWPTLSSFRFLFYLFLIPATPVSLVFKMNRYILLVWFLHFHRHNIQQMISHSSFLPWRWKIRPLKLSSVNNIAQWEFSDKNINDQIIWNM